MNKYALINSFITIGIFLLFVILACLFLVTLQNIMKAIEPENRRMKPEHVWLILIPLVGFVYTFLVVIAIANSCKLQLEKYSVFSQQKSTFGFGLAWAICLLASLFFKIFFIPTAVLLLIYWKKIYYIKKQILHLKEVFASKEANSIF